MTMMPPAPNAGLSERYWRDGFAFPIPVLTAPEVEHFRGALEYAEAHYPKPRKPLNDYLRANAHYVLKFAEDLSRHPRIVDAVSGVLGPDLICWGVDVFAKEPHSPRYVGWHQDITYWGMGHTDHEVTAWIALSEVTEANGCMRYVAGSHKNLVVDHVDRPVENAMLSRGQEIAVDIDEKDATPVVLKPGEMSLHHGRMFHASGPNQSDVRRIGVAIRYLRPDVDPEGRLEYATLVRGSDLFGHFRLAAGATEDFTPHGLDLHDRVTEAQEVALAAGADDFTYAR